MELTNFINDIQSCIQNSTQARGYTLGYLNGKGYQTVKDIPEEDRKRFLEELRKVK